MTENEDQLLDLEDIFLYGETSTPIRETKNPSSHVSILSSGYEEFQLKPELLRAIVDCGFKFPSKVEKLCIPQAVLGMDVIYQGKGRGKRTMFVLATLQQLNPVDNQVSVLVICHTKELAFQISKEYERYSKYMPPIKVNVFFGGTEMTDDEKILKTNCPHIVVGTPGRILALVKNKMLILKNVKHCVVDECDEILEAMEMRTVINIFEDMMQKKQVIILSATKNRAIQPICKKLMRNERPSRSENFKLTAPQATNSAKTASRSHRLVDGDELLNQQYFLNSNATATTKEKISVLTAKQLKRGYRRFMSESDSNSDSDD